MVQVRNAGEEAMKIALGCFAGLLVIAVVYSGAPDVQRYLKMRSM
jgi:hypothetical protein